MFYLLPKVIHIDNLIMSNTISHNITNICT